MNRVVAFAILEALLRLRVGKLGVDKQLRVFDVYAKFQKTEMTDTVVIK